jgi:hypothetical protein
MLQLVRGGIERLPLPSAAHWASAAALVVIEADDVDAHVRPARCPSDRLRVAHTSWPSVMSTMMRSPSADDRSPATCSSVARRRLGAQSSSDHRPGWRGNQSNDPNGASAGCRRASYRP